jgi:hypothetical protein
MVFAGMPGLHRLIYVSRLALTGPDLNVALGRIVHDSVHNNRHAAVTGLLFCHDGWFVQVLEGPAEAVQQTFARLAADPRHTDVKRISYEKVSGRLFADWDLCAKRFSDGDEILPTFGHRFDPSRIEPRKLLDLLVNVADRQRAALAA